MEDPKQPVRKFISSIIIHIHDALPISCLWIIGANGTVQPGAIPGGEHLGDSRAGANRRLVTYGGQDRGRRKPPLDVLRANPRRPPRPVSLQFFDGGRDLVLRRYRAVY